MSLSYIELCIGYIYASSADLKGGEEKKEKERERERKQVNRKRERKRERQRRPKQREEKGKRRSLSLVTKGEKAEALSIIFVVSRTSYHQSCIKVSASSCSSISVTR
jgi:hypothetical protein